MRVWSHRPQFSHWALFTAAYVVGCGFSKLLAIVPGSSVSFWPPGGLLMATLMLTPVPSWPWWILGGALAESFGQLVWFSSGLPIGFLIIAGNSLEAMAGAWLVNRVCGRPVRLETLHEVVTFVVLGACLAPVISATIGSATLWWFGIRSQTFWGSWPLWWIGDATGILIVAPLTLIAIQNWRGMAQLWTTRWIEVSLVGLTFLGVAALSLGGYLPFAYIVMPPLLWAAVRFDVKGAAILLILLALITAVFTWSGASQFAGDPASQKHKQVMLHLFLAVSALSALIVAAISRQHQQALLTLRESERQLQQMIDAVPVRIWGVPPAGGPVFFNKRYQDYLRSVIPNFDDLKEPNIEILVQELIHPEDAPGVQRTMQNCFETGGAGVMRFRWRQHDGAYRWAECRVEPRRNQDGTIGQWYGVSLDIDDEVRAQEALRERERELQQLVDALPVHVWSWTPDGKLAYVNKRSLEELGLSGANFEDCAKVAQQLVHPEDSPEVVRTSATCLKTGDVFTMRYRRRWKDGSYRWIEGRAEPLRDRDGTIVRWYQVSIDIDDQMRAEEALRDRERELSLLVDMVPVNIGRISPDGVPTFFNKRLVDFLGLDVTDLEKPGMSRLTAVMATAIHPDDAPGFADALKHSLATGEPLFRKYRLRRADGVYRWVDNRIEPVRDQSGAIVQWYGVSLDIDDQVRLYGELEEREARIRRLIDSDVLGIFFWDLDGTLIDANDAFLRMVQYDREDLKAGLDWFAMTPPEWQAVYAREEAEELARTGKMQGREKEFFRKDGSRVPVLIGAVCFEGNHSQGIAYILDLTERKRAEAALHDRERELRQLVDAVPAMIWSTTPQGTTTYLNKRFTDVTGAVLKDLFAPDGSPAPLSVAHPDDWAASTQVRARAFAAGTSYVLHYRQIRRDGTYRWTETRGEPLRDDSGAILQWYGVSVDIDDLVKAQEALRQSERELLQLVNMLPVYIRRLKPDGEPIFFNKRLTDFIGVDLEAIGAPGANRLAPTVENFVHPDEAPKLLASIRHSVATGVGYAMKYRMRRADGAYRWLETRAEPVRRQDSTIAQWYVVSIDVDDEVRAQQAEEALREISDRLAKATQAASLAELSASIAHEVNQPLAAIVANSHACQRWLSAEPVNVERAKITVERIIRDANSAADVVSRIRALFRQTAEPRNSARLSDAIAEARSLMAEEAARRRVRMDIDVESNLPLVAFDHVQIQQVLINLMRNGMDAMDAVAGDRILGMRVSRTGDVIRTEISDCGRGIEFPDKIFEPFFTTKENGMGMGLAICRSMVESHGGRLWAEMNQVHGATFIFTLPVEMKKAS